MSKPPYTHTLPPCRLLSYLFLRYLVMSLKIEENFFRRSASPVSGRPSIGEIAPPEFAALHKQYAAPHKMCCNAQGLCCNAQRRAAMLGDGDGDGMRRRACCIAISVSGGGRR